MTSLSPRALLPVGLLVGLSSACAHRSNTSSSSPPPSSSVTAEDAEHAPYQSIEQMLMGRFPGVQVARTPDGGVAVRIRGAASFMANTEPLYVLDGMPLQAEPGGHLKGINPYDIESIQVLKNPAETAIYGMRGANGVIVIKTKRPGRPRQ